MASSNRHWPRMFKSKPSCNQPWHHDLTITTPSPMLSTTSHKSPYTSGCEDRAPEPKPRWNPKPEQIQILEAIFNSGMINPPREEIHRIRLQLQQYGQVGDANVFYWFQNRKSRTKNKNKSRSNINNNRSSTVTGATNNANINTNIIPNTGIFANVNIPLSNSDSIMTSPLITNLINITAPPMITTTQTESSSSSERSSGSSKPVHVPPPMSVPEPVITMYNNNNNNNIHCSNNNNTELSGLPEPPFLFPNPNPNGYCFSIPELAGAGLGLWNELPIAAATTGDDHVGIKRKNNTDGDELHLHQHRFGLTNKGELVINNGGGNDENNVIKIGIHRDCCFDQVQPADVAVVANNNSSYSAAAAESVVTAAVETGADVACAAARTLLYCAPVNVMQDNSGGGGTGRLTVFIDEKPYQVPTSPLNIKSAFGNFVLMDSSGYLVPTDELHNTLQPLQHGASYYLVPIRYV